MSNKILFGPGPGLQQLPPDMDKWLPGPPSLVADACELGKYLDEREQFHWSPQVPKGMCALPVTWIGGRASREPIYLAQLGRTIGARKNLAGKPQCCLGRVYLEGTNKPAGEKLPYPGTPEAFCAEFDRAVAILRDNGASKEMLFVTVDFIPNAGPMPDELPRWIPQSAQGLGVDLYVPQNFIKGSHAYKCLRALVKAAIDRDLPIFAFETGLALPGIDDTAGSISHFDYLADFVEDYCLGWQLSSDNWPQGWGGPAKYWQDATISKNPGLLAHVKARLASMDLVEGPADFGTVGQTVAAMQALPVGAGAAT